MHTYSKNIIGFIEEIKQAVKKILASEIGVSVMGSRFLEWNKKYSYPISIVIYNDRKMLGYFDSEFLELGFNEKLMLSSKDQLYNVIRHELAHYMAFILYGPVVAHHGPEFKSLCERFGWGEEVSSATLKLETHNKGSVDNESTILRKVRKLMALTESSNIHERELAIVKCQQFLLKHNIDSKYVDAPDEKLIFVKRIMKQKQKNAKMQAIAVILETFFVNVIYNRSREYVYLEILGEAANIEIAEYVASILHLEMDNLWKEAKLSVNLKGMVAKNSFFIGIAKGYCEKIEALKRQYDYATSNAVMLIERALIDAKTMIYKRLSSTKQRGSYCNFSGDLGRQMGKELNISPAIKGSSAAILQIGMS